jgi:hypothetical protein
MVTGAVLLPAVLHGPIPAARGPLGAAYALSIVHVVLTTASCFADASFSWFLIHPEPTEGHFYKTLPQVLWDSKAAGLLLKTAAFALAAYDSDEARIVDWALHSFGDITFSGLLLPLTAGPFSRSSHERSRMRTRTPQSSPRWADPSWRT